MPACPPTQSQLGRVPPRGWEGLRVEPGRAAAGRSWAPHSNCAGPCSQGSPPVRVPLCPRSSSFDLSFSRCRFKNVLVVLPNNLCRGLEESKPIPPTPHPPRVSSSPSEQHPRAQSHVQGAGCGTRRPLTLGAGLSLPGPEDPVQRGLPGLAVSREPRRAPAGP